jgi:hypothetical protein
VKLSLAAQFDLLKFQTSVKETDDFDKLKEVTCTLIQSWYVQKEFIKMLQLQSIQQMARVNQNISENRNI